ncbi:MAG: amidohydrolase [Firmicutes bacterium]|nr:amidohydrolase [Bacillota bacterium]
MYEKYLNIIDEKKDEICALSDFLWDHPETAFKEFQCSKAIEDLLESEGFTVERGLGVLPTAFRATYGSGSPHLGILAEYDALNGMSQQAGVAEPAPIPGVNNFHGCGHNLFAAGSVAAAIAVKNYIEKTGKGCVTLFGCPAEEGGGGKVFMVRDGFFDGIDSVVSWHPESMYMVRTRPALANVKVRYKFTGVSAHAGADPEKGRSALDALELMNVGANFLREHMDLTSRIHYAILDNGGTAANIVQSHAEVFYVIRAVDLESVRDLHARVDRVAQGAALMTDTTVTPRVTCGYSNLITIPTLQAVANESMHDIEFPTPTEEDIEFGKALQKTVKLNAAQQAVGPYAAKVLDPAPPKAHGGSTDTADVSWNCPTVQMHIGTWVIGTPGHSWQSTAQGKSPYAKRAMLFAGKAIAGTIMRLMEDTSLIDQAKKEHAEKTASGYVCAIDKDAMPEGVM